LPFNTKITTFWKILFFFSFHTTQRKVDENLTSKTGIGKYFQRLHQLNQLKASPSFSGRPVPDIRVTLFIRWTFNGEFHLNLMSNIIRIFYFRMIFGSFDILSLVCPRIVGVLPH